MYSPPSTNRFSRALMPILGTSKSDRTLTRIMLWVLVIDMIILPALFAKLFLFPLTKSFVTTTDATNVSVPQTTTLGPATEHFLQRLRDNDMIPVAVGEIKRKPFTVSGQVVTLNGDNIQIFEYVDHETAMKEASLMVQRYTSSSRTLTQKEAMHLYVDGTLAIFYMGKQDYIVTSLDQNAGLSMIQPSKPSPAAITRVGI